MPVRVRRRVLRPDSGGAGTYRGGLGQVFEIESLADAPITVRAEHGKLSTAPRGSKGGLAGADGRILHNGREVPDKLPLQLIKGDVLTLEVPGSGGMLPAHGRDPDRLAADIADGFVSTAGAARDYGRAQAKGEPVHAG